jgi:glutathionylspermidine synthase
VRTVVPTTDYAGYVSAWERIARSGTRHLNFDVRAGDRRYLSLASVCLSRGEAEQLRELTVRFSRLLDLAVAGILDAPDWWSSLAWPWPAIELARQEPPHPGGLASLYGRFDYLLDASGAWQMIEYNADTPSGGREASGLEPSIARLVPGAQQLKAGLPGQLIRTLRDRIARHSRPVRVVGVVSSHSWLEDMAQATWLGWLLRRAGQPALVGDVTDLAVSRGGIALRGQHIDALYRFYPIERLYRHAIFASLCEASIEGRLLMLNGLRGFLAQSKACLAWLWANRSQLGKSALNTIERHLPATVLARDPGALDMLPGGVVKHVNGREGDSVVFGDRLDAAGWESRLLEAGYVVQRAVASQPLEDVEVDDLGRRVTCVSPRFACVGGFSIGGRFGGCYTRLDGPITSARASYVATLRQAESSSRRR